MRTIAANKKANYDFTIKEKFEAGLVLTGSEIKSLRVNTGSIKDSTKLLVKECMSELNLI